MTRSRAKRNQKDAKRLDTLLTLPLDRFRRALTRLTVEELAALGARLTVQRAKNRWARGGFGIARHRSPHALGLLARRETALRHEREARVAAAPAPIQLIFPETATLETAFEERAA